MRGDDGDALRVRGTKRTQTRLHYPMGSDRQRAYAVCRTADSGGGDTKGQGLGKRARMECQEVGCSRRWGARRGIYVYWEMRHDGLYIISTMRGPRQEIGDCDDNRRGREGMRNETRAESASLSNTRLVRSSSRIPNLHLHLLLLPAPSPHAPLRLRPTRIHGRARPQRWRVTKRRRALVAER